MNDLLVIAGCCFALGLLYGWLAGRVAGVEEERAKQIDRMTKKL